MGVTSLTGFRWSRVITAAARALAAGDPLEALERVALRDDAPALALRGIAMAQLGDLVGALLRRAARAFGPKEAVARARPGTGDARRARRPRERRACRNDLRRPAPVSARRGSHPEDRSEDRPCARHDPAPGGGDSGLAWAEGTLWVGHYRNRKIHQIDPQTGAILCTIESNRFVTGVTRIRLSDQVSM
jgi:hypothetical protein